MSEVKIATLIASDKGGVGKSLLAQIMVLASDAVKLPLNVIEIDHQRKLTSVFGDRVNLSLDASASIASISRDRRAAESFYDAAYELWASEDSVTDLGANVTTSLFDWMGNSRIRSLAEKDGIRFRFLAITTPDDQALRSATSALEKARLELGASASLFLVMNNFGGTGFDPYKGTQTWQAAMDTVEKCGVKIVEIPYCDSVIMEWVRALNVTLLDVLELNSPELEMIVQKASLGRVERHREVQKFSDWIVAVQNALGPVFGDQAETEPGEHAGVSAAA